MRHLFLLLTCAFLQSCAPRSGAAADALPAQFIVVLGITQDAGYPHPHCDKACCEAVWQGREARQQVCSLGIVDRETQQVFMLEASPDFPAQERNLRSYLQDPSQLLSGILLSHAHIGHYTGLMYLGREAMGAKAMPVYAMPRMADFLQQNGPWSQLLRLNNIQIVPLMPDSALQLTPNITITPMPVPHRDEYSETVGYRISGKNGKALFIPDIDKWSKWSRDIRDEVRQVDYALLDATFFENGEIPNRDMSEIPHPFVVETMRLFENRPERSRIFFIHLNHSNPLLWDAAARRRVEAKGFGLCRENQVLGL